VTVTERRWEDGMSKVSTALWFAALLGISAPAGATCAQSDVAGTWGAYALAAGSSGAYWLRCDLAVNATGQIVATSSKCTQSNGLTGSVTGTITLQNGSLCSFTGAFTISGTRSIIDQITLAPSKEAAEGVGHFSGGGFSYSLVRIR
jgi:hypothetical protein